MTKKKKPAKRYFDFCVELPEDFRSVSEKTDKQENIEKLLSEIVRECGADVFSPSHSSYDGKRGLAVILKSFADCLERESRAGFMNEKNSSVRSGCGAQLEEFISAHVFWREIHSLENFSRRYYEEYGWKKSYTVAPYVERLRQRAPLFHHISRQAKFIAQDKNIILQNARIDLSRDTKDDDYCYTPAMPDRVKGLPGNVALWERMGIADVNVSIFYALRSCFWHGSFEEVQRLGDAFLEMPEEMFLGSHQVVSFFEANIDIISGFREWILVNSRRGFFRREAINVMENLGLVGVVKSICVTVLDMMTKDGVIAKETVNGLVFFRSSTGQ